MRLVVGYVLAISVERTVSLGGPCSNEGLRNRKQPLDHRLGRFASNHDIDGVNFMNERNFVRGNYRGSLIKFSLTLHFSLDSIVSNIQNF